MPRTILTICLAACSLSAQGLVQSTLPEELRIPATQKLMLQAHGVGNQIYSCKFAEGRSAWTLRAPEAQLLDSDRRVVGRHFAGPTWEAQDGSRVVGKVAATMPSPDAQSIPWLRLDAVHHENNGTMSQVASIQRLNTHGGKAPIEGCTGSNSGAELRVPYQADYYFYASAR